MPLELAHTVHPEFLEVHVQGERLHGRELEESLSIWSDIFSISKNENRRNILAHNKARGRFPVKAQINLSFKIKEIGCTLGHRIAVISYNSEVYRNAQLIVRFMQGKGYSVQLYKNKEKARSWLLREKKKKSLKNIFDSLK